MVWNMFKVNNKDTRPKPSVSFDNFEQINAGWVPSNGKLEIVILSQEKYSQVTIFFLSISKLFLYFILTSFTHFTDT